MAKHKSVKSLVAKMSERLKALEPESPQMTKALNRIGVTLANRMIMTATQKRIIDTGALRASLNYRVEGNRVTAGSFGVRYARFHEFGAGLTPRAVRAMFAAMGKRGGPKRASKGVITFLGGGAAILKARPFVTPALELERARIQAIVREYLRGV